MRLLSFVLIVSEEFFGIKKWTRGWSDFDIVWEVSKVVYTPQASDCWRLRFRYQLGRNAQYDGVQKDAHSVRHGALYTRNCADWSPSYFTYLHKWELNLNSRNLTEEANVWDFILAPSIVLCLDVCGLMVHVTQTSKNAPAERFYLRCKIGRGKGTGRQR